MTTTKEKKEMLQSFRVTVRNAFIEFSGTVEAKSQDKAEAIVKEWITAGIQCSPA